MPHNAPTPKPTNISVGKCASDLNLKYDMRRGGIDAAPYIRYFFHPSSG